ncbi:MAG: toxin-antitoxin system YwqK family antitoxin [Bacteroidia bacterium]
MLNKVSVFLFLFFIPGICISQKINRFKNKERQGKWVIYHDSTETHIDNIGKYRKGAPKGVWKYYDENGRIAKKEKYRFRKIYTTFYHPNGKVQKQGKAKVVKEDKLLHFYFYGNWYVYDSTGALISKQVFESGKKISEINYNTKSPTGINDSVVLALKQIDGQLRLYFDTVQIAENKFGKNSPQYERAVSLNALHTSKLLIDLDKLILKFGYPGRTLAGEYYSIAFSIISSANTGYKEKYLKLIIDAANKKELDWADVVFFVDKVKVAKKEKQLYCTQYEIDYARSKFLYYPVEEIEKLNDRRKSVGVDEIDLTTLEFTHY